MSTTTVTCTEFHFLRLSTGLAVQDVATLAGVNLRTAQRWETTLTPPADIVDLLQDRYDRALDRIDLTLSAARAGRLPGPLPHYRPGEDAQCRADTGMTVSEHSAMLTHLRMAGELQHISTHVELHSPTDGAVTTARALNLDTERVGGVLALYGLTIYTAGARLLEKDRQLSVTADWTTVATRIRDHAAAVVGAEWTLPDPTTGRQLLSPTVTRGFTHPEHWDRWLTRRSRLASTADPVSASWLDALFCPPEDQAVARAGWNALDMLPESRGNNQIRRLHRLAVALADRPVDDIVAGLTGTVTREATRWQVTGGTWDRPGQDTSGIDDVWGWLSLLGMTYLPATPTGTAGVLGNTFDGWIVLPLRTGPLTRLALQDTTEVIRGVNDISSALHQGTVGQFLIPPLIRELPPVQVWKIVTQSTGNTVTRRAERRTIDDLTKALMASPPIIGTGQSSSANRLPPRRPARAGHRSSDSRTRATKRARASETATPAKIRAWGIAHGYAVGSRGALPGELREAFYRARNGSAAD